MKKTGTIRLRIAETDKRRMTEAAKRHGLSLSSWMRLALTTFELNNRLIQKGK